MEWSLTPIEDFERIAAEWDSLNGSLADLPILDSRFFALAMRHFGVHGRAVVALLRDGDEARCAAILEPAKLRTWQTYQPAQAPLGAWVHGPGFDPGAALPLIFRAAGGRFSLGLGVSQLDPELLARPEDLARGQTLDYIDTAIVHVAGSFEDYWAGRGKNLRQNVRRQRSRFERDGVELRLRTVTEPDEIGAAVDDYARLESQGWKGAAGTALHPDNAQGRFYRALLEAYGAQGEAIVYQYRYGDTLVASDLCLARKGVLIILKTTHDEAQRNTSPAMLMHHEILQPIFDERRFRRIEFYGKLMEWHGRLTEEKKVLYHLNYFRFPWLMRLAAARSKAAAVPAQAAAAEQSDESTSV